MCVVQFIVILEDDLTLAADTVKYFHAMSRVMAVDPTLYCACAHQDNAFLATSNDDPVPHSPSPSTPSINACITHFGSTLCSQTGQ
jgi:hypothetical protein